MGVMVTVLLLYWLFTGVLFSRFVSIANTTYGRSNKKTDAGITQPTSPLRSGSAESLVPWDTLGRQGQKFVARGATKEQIAQFAGRAALQPIRIYAGVDSAPTIDKRTDLVLKELDRTKAFDRKILVVIVPTGTGWIEPQSADSIEYMFNGDTAEVAVQYSFLPSWMSFVVDKQKATEAGQSLINGVYDKWSQLPEGKRPKLIVYGLSLGSYGAQSAFSGADDLKNRTDGALFVGTPNDTKLWQMFTKKRQTNSPERLPVFEDRQQIRFASNAQDITNDETWETPRTLYLQHASDSVVWWNPKLILSEPDWLNESKGPDVSTKMRWFPFVTFAQVSVDQFAGTKVPQGYGHNYANSIVSAWAAVTSPQDWNQQKTTQLQTIIDGYEN